MWFVFCTSESAESRGVEGHAVSGREVRVRVVSALVVIVLDVETREFGEVDPQCAAAIVNILPVQGLK